MPAPHQSPARADLLAQVERIKDITLRHASESERRRTLAPAIVDALGSSGLFAMAAPREVGGAECDPLTAVEVFEAMARVDTAAGWSLMISSMTAALAGAYLSDEGIKRIFQGSVPTFAGLQQPAGTARRVPGGYVVRGRWGFGSGVRHARWIFTVAAVEPAGGEPPAGLPPMINIAVEADKVRIEDTWDTAGLRGSGSEHYSLEDVFVADELTCPFPSAPQRRGGPVFALPMIAYLTPAHVGFALGAARRALDEITALAPKRVKLWPQVTVGSHPAFAMDLGRAEAKLAAARAYAFSALGTMWDRAQAGNPLSLEDWAGIRLSSTYVTDVAAEVVTFAYRSGGASALYASSPLQQVFRDIHAATQHIAATDDAYEFAGRVRLGNASEHIFYTPRPR